ncbi:ComEC/Rec2 family competence protein [Iamia majanohamensis]|uniref:ComEC/Rec2 family competence protein n=1 Tax=Iamia majanohamensis TaxID=467976 RepID=A0AAE9Y751_9ACTN|nr:ComEC/Rec2 family competence protein [Iamia majanohamensis]WCO65623.1 ComEC/Rec2 family competence protein [Iamia majanohamensis]
MALIVPVALLAVALAVRRPALLVLAAGLAASSLAARADAGMEPPAPREVAGQVTLVGDPEARWGGVEVVARLEGRLVLLVADPPAAETVLARLAGERVRVEGRLGPLPDDASWLRVRHVSGRLTVTDAAPGGEAAAPWRAANHLRRTLADGAAGLGPDRRSLFLGLVLGDDREQSPEVTDDFRGSGLSHLLAVSGQNVAFVLAVAAPVLRRAGPGTRVVLVVVLLALFATVTRFEPSVLRAVAMAGAALVATTRGRPTTGVHLLALAVTGLVLVDPFLVRSTGFRLSVAATAGIVVLGPRLLAALPLPPALGLPVAVTASAQLGVAPLLVGTFGGVPVASLPANVLAAPAAALVMTWGLPAGVVAGLVPSIAGPAHVPTAVALDWVAGVARRASSVPLGELGWPHLAALGAAVGLAVLAGGARRSRRLLGAVACAVALGALVAPGLALTRPPVHAAPVAGVEVWRAGGATVVVVAPGTGPADTLEGLRLAGVTRLDVLVLGPGSGAGDEERAARHRLAPGRVLWLGRDPPGAVRLGGLVVVATDEAACVAPASAAPCTPPVDED